MIMGTILGVSVTLDWSVLINNNQLTFTGHIVTVVIGLSLVLLGRMLLIINMKKFGENWFPKLEELENHSILENKKLSEDTIKERFKDQLKQVYRRLETHRYVVILIYRRRYISNIMMMGGALGASICLLFISTQGWQKSNQVLIDIFIVTLSVFVLYRNIPLVFKYNENIIHNQTLYNEYFKLRNELLSYFCTLENIEGEKIEEQQFIHYVDRRLQQISEFTLDFDETKIISPRDAFQGLINAQQQKKDDSQNTPK